MQYTRPLAAMLLRALMVQLRRLAAFGARQPSRLEFMESDLVLSHGGGAELGLAV